MSIIHKIRTSFTTQLTLWVASLVTVIKAVVKSHNLCFAGFVYKQVGLITAPAGCAPRQG